MRICLFQQCTGYYYIIMGYFTYVALIGWKSIQLHPEAFCFGHHLFLPLPLPLVTPEAQEHDGSIGHTGDQPGAAGGRSPQQGVPGHRGRVQRRLLPAVPPGGDGAGQRGGPQIRGQVSGKLTGER